MVACKQKISVTIFCKRIKINKIRRIIPSIQNSLSCDEYRKLFQNLLSVGKSRCWIGYSFFLESRRPPTQKGVLRERTKDTSLSDRTG